MRERLHEIIFEADTAAGKAFDVALLLLILVSVVATSLETVETIGTRYQSAFAAIEWTITVLFTVEYMLRIWTVKRPWAYVFSFYGIVDLLSILPTFLGLIINSHGTSRLAVIRSLRLLRVFRVFDLGWFVSEANALRDAFWKSRAKVVIFLFTVLIIVTLTGTLMYLLENERNQKLNSIPDGIYWAVVTMTTVGYGDIVPLTATGKFISAILILLGYSLIIVPTGFVSAELVDARKVSTQACAHCMSEGHQHDAKFCRICGAPL